MEVILRLRNVVFTKINDGVLFLHENDSDDFPDEPAKFGWYGRDYTAARNS